MNIVLNRTDISLLNCKNYNSINNKCVNKDASSIRPESDLHLQLSFPHKVACLAITGSFLLRLSLPESNSHFKQDAVLRRNKLPKTSPTPLYSQASDSRCFAVIAYVDYRGG